jgi:hypothetical protein
MKQIGIWLVNGALAYIAMAGAMGATTSSAVSQPGPVIRIEDVTRFYKVYDAAGGHPTVDQLQHDYLDPGSGGLHELTELRHVTGAAIVEEIEARLQMYSDLIRMIARFG